jgi:DNA-directed RNA polymerase specialized sigma24 family protein
LESSAVTLTAEDQKLIAAYRQGDEAAATELLEKYYVRLLELIRRQLGWKLRDLEGSTDVAQSVFRSFFSQVRENRVQIAPDNSLWPLLVTIALNKVRNLGKYWQREKRDPGRQVRLEGQDDPLENGPSPQDVAAVKELVDRLLEPFSPRRRRIIELILEGEAVGQIAQQVGATERTVYNTRRAAAKILEQVLASSGSQA